MRLESSRAITHTTAVEPALLVYVLYNVVATVVSLPAGHLADRRTTVLVFGIGIACFLFAYLSLAPSGVLLLVLGFLMAGVGIACAETAENAVVAELAPSEIRGSAFGVLAGVQSLGNFVASVAAGVLWSTASAEVAFLFLALLMMVSIVVLVFPRSSRSYPARAPHFH